MEILKKTAAFRVQKQVEGLPVEEVKQLSLSGVPVLPELWAPFTHLTHLVLVCMKPKLARLDLLGLGTFSALRLLDVSDNAVAVPAALPSVPSLVRLLMPNNRVAEMAEVQRLAVAFPLLEVLDLADNAVDTPDNFAAVFGALPALVALNCRTRDGTEVVVEDSDESESEDESDEEGEGGDDSDSQSSTDTADEAEGSDCEAEASGSDGAPAAKKTRTEGEN